ncbi:MAG: phage tail protein [Syntrophorhabdaceae bacterium]|nr:phage tail protein [Syntrophorhabdaceae bacterium]
MKDEFNIQLLGIKEALAMFDPQKVVAASRKSVERVSSSAITHASREIRTEYNIKAKDLRKFLRMSTRPKGYSIEAVITGTGLGLALAGFDAKQTGVKTAKGGFQYTKRATRSGWQRYGGDVTVRVKVSSGRKVVSGKYGNKPFIARMKSGHLGVWVRQSEERLPILQLFGPGVGGLFGSKRIMESTEKHINEIFPKEFHHNLDYYLGRKS